MPFGGLAPLPLRLGGNDENGLLATEHARISADLTALCRVAPLAVVQFSFASGGSITSYSGQNGVGIAAGPSISVAGNSVATLTWDDGYSDAYDNYHAFTIRQVAGNITSTPVEGFATAVIDANNVIIVYAWQDDGTALTNRDAMAVIW